MLLLAILVGLLGSAFPFAAQHSLAAAGLIGGGAAGAAVLLLHAIVGR